MKKQKAADSVTLNKVLRCHGYRLITAVIKAASTIY